MPWNDELPDDLKAAPALKDVKDLPSLAKQFVDLQSHLGNSIRIPGPDASEADRKAFYDKIVEKAPGVIPAPNPEDKEATTALWKKLGRPESKDGYKIPDGIDQSEVNDILDLAFEAGATVEQAQVLVTKAAERKKNLTEQQKQQLENNIKETRKAWGVAYEDRVESIKNTLKQMNAPEDLLSGVDTGAVGPKTMEWLHSLASSFKGGTPPPKDGPVKLTPVEARMRISEIMNNPDHPYWKPGDPANAAALSQMVELHRMAASS